MTTTPKSLRLHVGLFGRTNVGKSSFLNLLAGQETAIVSSQPGTTTDVVEKPMELLPVGPVVFLDTAGVDDDTSVGRLRVARSYGALERSDVAILVLEAERWTGYEDALVEAAGKRRVPLVAVVNKADLCPPSRDFLAGLQARCPRILTVSSVGPQGREAALRGLTRFLLEVCPDDFLSPPPLLADLLPSGDRTPMALFVVPIDLQAPRGRLILPQVQAIRDCLDSDAAVLVVKEREYGAVLPSLSVSPDLVVCDSQIVLKAVADTPPGVRLTTFSILMSRVKGDLVEAARGAAALSRLRPGDRVLIAEACSHHALEDDIGRVKIPRWIRQYAGADVAVDVSQGRDYPADLGRYRLVVHCGACALTRREMLGRIEQARAAGVPVTNYGMAISVLQGVIERTLGPFPAALAAFRRERSAHGAGASAGAGPEAAAGGHAVSAAREGAHD